MATVNFLLPVSLKFNSRHQAAEAVCPASELIIKIHTYNDTELYVVQSHDLWSVGHLI